MKNCELNIAESGLQFLFSLEVEDFSGTSNDMFLSKEFILEVLKFLIRDLPCIVKWLVGG